MSLKVYYDDERHRRAYLKEDVDLAVRQLKDQILKYPSLYNSPKRIVRLIEEEFQ